MRPSTIAWMTEQAQHPFGQAAPAVLRSAFDPKTEALFDQATAEQLYADYDFRTGEFEPGHEKLTVVYGQAAVDVADYEDPAAARQWLSKGATILYRSLHRYTDVPVPTCQQLANTTGLPAHINGYMTPPNEQGFPLHSDPDSVFALQHQGHKTWLIFSRLTDDVNDADKIFWVHEEGRSREVAPPEKAAHTITVHPGDIVFVPRGWPHYVLSGSGEISVHASIGLLHPEMDAHKIAQQAPIMPAS